MTIRQQTRRDILKTTAALAATASVGPIIGRAAAQGGAAQSRQIDAVLSRATEAKEVPGVVAMAANDKGIIYQGAFGTRDLAQGPAMTLDTIFRLASMTKAVTSVAAMQLVEQGKLRLDQPIGGVLPELSAPQVLEGFDDAGAPRMRPAKRPITLRHLLTHTAGFAYPVWTRRSAAISRHRAHRPGILVSSPRCGCHWSSTRVSGGSTGSTSIGPGEWSRQSAGCRSRFISASASLRRSACRTPITWSPPRSGRA